MEVNQFVLFINRLSEKTKIGSLKWRSLTESMFVLDVGDNRISISQSFNEDSDPDYTDPDYYIHIYDRNGVFIDSFGDQEIQEYLPGAFKLMQGIYRDAMRTARGLDATIGDILKTWDDEF